MTNFYTDPDSTAAFRRIRWSPLLLQEAPLDPGALEADYGTMSTVLHEASHNLGPSAEYEVKGKKDAEVFPAAPSRPPSRELKAQTKKARSTSPTGWWRRR